MPRKVYRLENSQGNGPYHGNQPCVNYLTPHNDPDKMLKQWGLPVEVLKALSQAQFVFGWKRLSDYNKFFKKNGQAKCSELGFNLTIYRPELRFDFPDGQVMFFKPGVTLDVPYLKTFLIAIKKIQVNNYMISK